MHVHLQPETTEIQAQPLAHATIVKSIEWPWYATVSQLPIATSTEQIGNIDNS